MKKYLALLLLYFTYFNLRCQPETIWQLLQNGQIIRWAYTFGDEFNDSSFDESKWLNSYAWGRNYAGTCYQEYMTDGQNIELDNGILKLIAKEESVYARGVPYESDNYLLDDNHPNLRWWNYTSGMIFSKRKFKYGLFEIRFKLPTGKGLWPAFWLYGGNPNEEFDIFEYKGETPSKIHINMHCPSNACSNFGGWVTATGSFASGFNTMMGEWRPNMAFWYLNGQEFAIFLGNLNYQAHLIANLGIANDAPCPFNPGPDITTSFPAIFEIDYIRVWTRLDCDQTINISNYNQTATDPTAITAKNITFQSTSLPQNDWLSLIATNEITINHETNIEGKFEANVVDCPVPSSSNLISNNNSKHFSNKFTFAQSASPEVFTDSSDSKINYKKYNIHPSDNIIQKAIPIHSNYTADSKHYETGKQQNASKFNNLNKPILYTKIYPNPTNGIIKVEFEGKVTQKINLKIINSKGATLINRNVTSTETLIFNLSEYPKGIYYIVGDFNGNLVTKKIIFSN